MFAQSQAVMFFWRYAIYWEFIRKMETLKEDLINKILSKNNFKIKQVPHLSLISHGKETFSIFLLGFTSGFFRVLKFSEEEQAQFTHTHIHTQ